MTELSEEQIKHNRLTAKFMINNLIPLNKKNKISGWNKTNEMVSPQQFSVIIDLIEKEVISNNVAKELLEIIWNEGGNPIEILEMRGMIQKSDGLEEIINEIIALNEDKAEEVKLKPNIIGWFVGQAMKKTNGKANPKILNDMFKKKLCEYK